MSDISAIDAGACSVGDLLFGEKVFRAPVFQRYYVWKTTKELPLLWADIDEIIDGQAPNRFLGAIVLQRFGTDLPSDPTKRYWLIDGQQRMTTLFLFLLAIARTKELHERPDGAADLLTGWILNQGSKQRDQPKVLPTSQDFEQFRTCLTEIATKNVSLPPQYGETKGNLAQMYQQIRADLESRISQRGEGYLDEILAAIVAGLELVQIILPAAQDAQEVFDILNTRGVKLETADLARNLVFQKFADDVDSAQSFFEGYWRPFEATLGRDGLAAFFFPFALIEKPNATKANAFDELRSKWKSVTPLQILGELSQYVEPFLALTDSSYNFEAPRNLRRAAWNLARMPAPAVTLPYTMRVLREWRQGSVSAAAGADALRVVESFLVRRSFNGLEPTGLHAVFKRLWSSAGADAAAVVKEIDKSATIEFPTDQDFARDVEVSRLAQRRLAKYVLDQYDRDLTGGDPIPQDAAPASIDHVMPQSRRSPYWRSEVSDSAHTSLVDTWANLVPLSMPQNSRKQDWAWDRVRRFYREEANYKAPRRLAALLKWNEAAIRKRARDLSAYAVKRWPRSI